jgi:restriction system protein
MSAATWDQYMALSLRVLLDGEIHRSRRIVEGAAELLKLTAEQRQIVIPSGQERGLTAATGPSRT